MCLSYILYTVYWLSGTVLYLYVYIKSLDTNLRINLCILYLPFRQVTSIGGLSEGQRTSIGGLSEGQWTGIGGLSEGQWTGIGGLSERWRAYIGGLSVIWRTNIRGFPKG
jgi:hypothetical protein